MRAVVQRVVSSRVLIKNKNIGEIKKGLLVFLGVSNEDIEADAEYLASKIMNLRIFDDHEGKMNLSLLDIKGEILVVSQFTLYGDCRKGRRPSYTKAALPEKAKTLYEAFIRNCEVYSVCVKTGRFQEEMTVEISNDGPVTLLLDSNKEF